MWAPAHELAEGVRSGRTSARTLVERSLARIEAVNGRVNAFVQVNGAAALARADAVDAQARAGRDPGPLAGVPVAVKDNICTVEGRTTCGSAILREYRSPFDAAAVEKLHAAGAVIVGKTNLDEFAMGSSTETSVFGPTRNPWDLSRVPGGSSGGSAAAVAAGCVPVALGSDTGGSIRQPASHCGVVGLKPTYGRVSRWGLVAYASSLDQIGPLCLRVADCALVARVVAGHDRRDSTSAHADPAEIDREVERPLEGLVVGVPAEARSGGNHAGVVAAVEGTLDALQRAGAKVADITLPHAELGIAAYYLIATAEASSNLARFDGVRFGRRAALQGGESLDALYRRSRGEGFGHEVRKRIMLGTHALSSGYYDAYYARALKVRRLIKQDFDAAFARGCHAVVMPASPGPAFAIGGKNGGGGDPLAMYLEDAFTVGVNLAGLPAIAVPAGFAQEPGVELPIGVQLIGPALSENTLLRAAAMVERGCGVAGRMPLVA
ncbi:MAG TPA: Asp-tRNA(Asn)/Glu-tRNA(Gln) amidotransferase subunit GatA [Phycisphaerales bacterium]|nr:Asp-tRNA(Asn)/Glu-tRNA(Gln) amidotransferase subunit GatA [Phycisphaerales bacterium]